MKHKHWAWLGGLGGVVSQRDVGEEVGDRLTVVRAPYRLSQNHADINHLVTPTKTNHDILYLITPSQAIYIHVHVASIIAS